MNEPTTAAEFADYIMEIVERAAAEAVVAERKRIAEAVLGLSVASWHKEDPTHPDALMVQRAAVLAIVTEPQP